MRIYDHEIYFAILQQMEYAQHFTYLGEAHITTMEAKNYSHIEMRNSGRGDVASLWSPSKFSSIKYI